MKNLGLLFLLFLTLQLTAQQKTPAFNISLEAGLGYNTLSWEGREIPISNNRNQFMLLPNAKVRLSFFLARIGQMAFLSLDPFVGYHMFGGKSATSENGYKDIFILQSGEYGILPTLNINNLSFYGGIKIQSIFSAKQKHYGFIVDHESASKEWATRDVSEFFKKRSSSAGGGINYKHGKFYLGAEVWIGISELSAFELFHNHENNYRFIVGYRIR